MAIILLAFCALLWLAPVSALADRGQGSIRGAARPARPAPAPPRPPARVEPPHAPPAVHPEDHAQPPRRVEPPVRRDWDDNDEDPQHFGGFGHGAPVRAIRGQRVHDLPPRHIFISFNNQNYYGDDDGAYYQQQPDGEYLVVQPPVGAIIAALPSGVTPIVVGPTTYYYLDGVFYVAQDNSFAVVNPPAGIVVPALPTGANTVVINGTVYYQFDGFNYEPSIQDGVTVYTVTPA